MSAAQDLHLPEQTPSSSQWLYRQGDLVLGPLTGQQLVDKLYAGAITGDTEVSSSGPGGFRKIKDLESFQLHVAQAGVKLRVEAEARAARARRNRQQLVAGIMALALFAALGFGAWQLSRYAAVYLPGASDEFTLQVEPPVITPARRSLPEELFDYPGEPKRTAARPTETPPDKPAVDAPPETKPPEKVASADPKPGRKSRAKGQVSTDPDGLSTEVNYDMGAINRVVKAQQGSLSHCFKEEVARSPGFAAKVPLEFTIGNDGRVAQLWIDNPKLKKGPLFECLLGELKKWPFKAYTGERATVNLAFTIGRK
ncbi:MAG: AgmX/PglI C-terminal domain-containing protein [Cystobacter sp.]